MKRVGAFLVVIVALAGCGSSAGSTASTTTISEHQANAQCATPSVPCAAPPPGLRYVIECGAGLSTNGSCVFARRAQAALAAAHPAAGTALRITAAQTTNLMVCSPSGSGWRCHSLHSLVWVSIPRS